MSAHLDNPHFKNIDRAPYELGYLLQELPRHFDRDARLSIEHVQMAEAAAQHADNANDTLMHGLAALGHLLFSASNCTEYPVSQNHLADIGMLIKHLAVEAQLLREIEGSMRYALQDDKDTWRETSAQPNLKKGGAK